MWRGLPPRFSRFSRRTYSYWHIYLLNEASATSCTKVLKRNVAAKSFEISMLILQTFMDIEYWKSSFRDFWNWRAISKSYLIILTSETSLIWTESSAFESPPTLLAVAEPWCFFMWRDMLLLLTAWPHTLHGTLASFFPIRLLDALTEPASSSATSRTLFLARFFCSSDIAIYVGAGYCYC